LPCPVLTAPGAAVERLKALLSGYFRAADLRRRPSSGATASGGNFE